MPSTLKHFLLGKARDPFDPKVRGHIALMAFLAWVGLGADGLSSACYGPEEAFLALGSHTHLALYISLLTAFSIFILATAYNQVITLFPSGGGGYKVASQLLGPYPGLVAGSALIIDYVLTIAISIASGTDAFFSLISKEWHQHKVAVEVSAIVLLIILNLRGMKESIRMLLPIFLSFIVGHVFIIVYGLYKHHTELAFIVPATLAETQQLSQSIGWLGVLAVTLRAYSYGAGTYTGLEAVSNSVHQLAEPRVRTGQLTMRYMAISLSFMACGIMLLYLLWNAQHVPGKTLNAVVFQNILGADKGLAHAFWVFLMFSEAGLLFVAANTGFIAGPTVLANMSVDSWIPKRFCQLSERLVTHNGILFYGGMALVVLIWSAGSVPVLIVLYSINVFLTFSLSLAGLCRYFFREKNTPQRLRKLFLSLLALGLALSILFSTIYTKFSLGGWLTLAITSSMIIPSIFIRKHYEKTERLLDALDRNLGPLAHLPATPASNTRVKPIVYDGHTASGPESPNEAFRAETQSPISLSRQLPLPLDPTKATAVILADEHPGVTMHTLLWALRLFPKHFHNILFVRVGRVDVASFRGEEELERMKNSVNDMLRGFESYCHEHRLPCGFFTDFGAEPLEKLEALSEQIHREYPNAVFFASRLVVEPDPTGLNALLHNSTSLSLQRRFHRRGRHMIILPMRLSRETEG